MAKISVIVPIYNVEKYLRKCLNSIIRQTFEDIEIILINDGSKDNSLKIIREYEAKDKRIVVIDKPNGGYGSACNVGLDRATGEYVAIVEPDDYIKRTMYEDLYNLSQKYEVDVVKSCFYKVLDTKRLKKILKENWSGRFEIPDTPFTVFEHPEFLFFHPSIWSAIYKREYLKEKNIRFIEAPGSGWTDNPFRAQVYCLGARILYTDKAYYFWRNICLKEEDALNDITIPYKRSYEIHQWLRENNINDENILAFLYKIETVYIHILLRKIGITNYFKIKKEIKNMLSLIDENIYLNNKHILPNEKKRYLIMKNNFSKFFFKYSLINNLRLFIGIKNELKLYFLIHTNKNVVLWGASLFLEYFLKKYHIRTKNIIGIVDKNSKRWGENIRKYKIYSPDFLEKVEKGKVIMTIANFGEERYIQLANLIKEKYPNVEFLPNIFKELI